MCLLNTKKLYVRYISHELRTPMNSACLGLKLLVDDFKQNNSDMESTHNLYRLEILNDIQSATHTTLNILNDLLCFEKLESGLLDLHCLKVNVMTLISQNVLMFSNESKEKGISTVYNFQSISGQNQSSAILAGDEVFCDRFKVDQVLRNLMSNALKFTQKGGKVTVNAVFEINQTPNVKKSSKKVRQKVKYGSSYIVPTVGSACEEGMLVVTFTDTGAGISVENQKRLFKDVVQFKPEILQAGGGSGFGLYLAKSIVDLHGGELSVFSEGEGFGTTFTVKLPMTRDKIHVEGEEEVVVKIEEVGNEVESFPYHQDTKAANSVLPIDVNPVVNTTKVCNTESVVNKKVYNLLVVDDSLMNRKMLSRALTQAGHHCDMAEDGQQAVQKAMLKLKLNETNLSDSAAGGGGENSANQEKATVSRSAYDAILMDFVMPIMDGPNATSELRKQGYKGIIIGVTGNGEFRYEFNFVYKYFVFNTFTIKRY